MIEIDDRIRESMSTIDSSGIAQIEVIKPEREDLRVFCKSGRKYVLRFDDDPNATMRQKWGYEQLAKNELPGPRVLAVLQKGKPFEKDCLVTEWLDAMTASQALDRFGQARDTQEMCRQIGRTLKQLHEVRVTNLPDYVWRNNRKTFEDAVRNFPLQLENAGLAQKDFGKDLAGLSAPYLDLIPLDTPDTLCFSDIHFSNVLVGEDNPMEIVGIIDTEEMGAGWPYWDFTNMECWGIRFNRNWTRKYLLEGYGPVDMDLYRFAVMLRLCRPDTFKGQIKARALQAIKAQDVSKFDLDTIYT